MTASVMKGLNEKYKDYGKQQLKLRELKIRNKIKTLLQLVLYQSYYATKLIITIKFLYQITMLKLKNTFGDTLKLSLIMTRI